jgi:hypothetical protein
VPGQPGLHSENLTKKTKPKTKQNKKVAVKLAESRIKPGGKVLLMKYMPQAGLKLKILLPQLLEGGLWVCTTTPG